MSPATYQFSGWYRWYCTQGLCKVAVGACRFGNTRGWCKSRAGMAPGWTVRVSKPFTAPGGCHAACSSSFIAARRGQPRTGVPDGLLELWHVCSVPALTARSPLRGHRRARTSGSGAQLAVTDAGALASPRRTDGRNRGSLLGRCPMLRHSLPLHRWTSGLFAAGRASK